MESVYKNTFFGLKMMVKSGLEKTILKSFHVGRKSFSFLSSDFAHFYEVRKSSAPHEGISKIFFRPLFTITFRPKIFRYRFHFEGKNDV